MTITNINNRDDWYLATQKQGLKVYVGHGTTRYEALSDVIRQLKQSFGLGCVLLGSPYKTDSERFG